MIPLVATGIAAIATITVGTILGFMIDGMELSITSKEITEIQNLKGVENLHRIIAYECFSYTSDKNILYLHHVQAQHPALL